ncbi:DUF433 domain-containing protein [Planktothrix tepida]|uniref:DUF433 domain-containing protein n=1 Tax=Planktothrix tepida TaxID=1678309 RepID=UPI000934C6F0|nr:DUF433 domain-containing protein [Planktothrix tepida]
MGRFDTLRLGGTPAFVGTRVSMKTLLNDLEAGDPLDKFLDHLKNTLSLFQRDSKN